ncbi:corticotropin-releasing factor-binding protein [Trichonephila clavipes]|nr:corticotropin-releasing factor-binding protein [Trichonephila clavipes]
MQKKNIETLQSENRKTYNRRRKKASLYKEGDLVAIQRTQFEAVLKLRPKFLGPYKVTKVNSKDRYEVEKVVDGWELNGQFFPGTEDHPKPAENRFAEFCGENRPWKTQITSQNVGLLEFRIPVKGEGFTVAVEFLPNPKPCNAVLQQPSGVYTLRNYGQRVNCTMSIIFPETFQILASSVGTQSMPMTGRTMDVETGIVKKCKKLGSEDYVEVRGGDGLDPSMMTVAEDFCGMDSVPGRSSVDVACGNSAVRLSAQRFWKLPDSLHTHFRWGIGSVEIDLIASNSLKQK